MTSVAQLAEIVNVLTRPRLRRFIRDGEPEAIVGNIHTRALVLHELPSVNLAHDPADNPILATAIAGRANLIVSGDKKHVLALEEVRGIPIFTARDALKRLGAADDLSPSDRR